MSIGLIGTKIGMTREFMESGQSVPVTVIKVEKGRVLDVISKEKRGYSAVKIGFFKLKNSKLTKQMKGYFAKKNTEPKKILKEFRVENNDQFKEGNELGLEIFKDKKFLDVRSKNEHKSESLLNSINIPLIDLSKSIDKVSFEKTFYVHCKGGYRSMIAASILLANGISNFSNIPGGYDKIKNYNS